MKKMPATRFKAQCLSVMDAVSETGESVVVTKRGKPVVRIVPAKDKPKPFLGRLKGIIQVVGDISQPVPLEDWELD